MHGHTRVTRAREETRNTGDRSRPISGIHSLGDDGGEGSGVYEANDEKNGEDGEENEGGNEEREGEEEEKTGEAKRKRNQEEPMRWSVEREVITISSRTEGSLLRLRGTHLPFFWIYLYYFMILLFDLIYLITCYPLYLLSHLL